MKNHYIPANRLPLWIVACLFLFIAACGKKEKDEPKPEQTADFTYTGTLRSFNPIDFKNVAPGAQSYSWNFGDGSTSTLPNPSHAYQTPGSYAVVLSATGANGTASVSKDLSVAAGQSVDFRTVASLWDSQPVTFVSEAPGATSFLWDFGNGASSTINNPAHLFQAGTHSVTLSVNGPNGSGQIRKNIVVGAAAPINAKILGTYTCGKIIHSMTANVDPPYGTTYTRLPNGTVEITNGGNGNVLVRVPSLNLPNVSHLLSGYFPSPNPGGGLSSGPSYPHYSFSPDSRIINPYYRAGYLFLGQNNDSLLFRIEMQGLRYTSVYHIYGKK